MLKGKKFDAFTLFIDVECPFSVVERRFIDVERRFSVDERRFKQTEKRNVPKKSNNFS